MSAFMKEEFFHLSAIAVMKRDPTIGEVSSSDISALFKKARSQGIPFYEWNSWLTTNLSPPSNDSKAGPRGELAKKLNLTDFMLGDSIATFSVTVYVRGPLGLEISEERDTGRIIITGFTKMKRNPSPRKSKGKIDLLIHDLVWGKGAADNYSKLQRSGIVKRGDFLIEINSEPVLGMAFDQVVERLREPRRPLSLAFQRNLFKAELVPI